jgi:hypothetical protein
MAFVALEQYFQRRRASSVIAWLPTGADLEELCFSWKIMKNPRRIF